MRIWFSMLHILSILNKMEAWSTKTGSEYQMVTDVDWLNTIFSPEKWVLDFDCLVSGMDIEAKFSVKILATIFMPVVLLILDFFLIYCLTFCVKFCQFREANLRKPLNCDRLKNRVLVAISMQLFFIYPTILYTLFSTFQCYEALSEDELYTSVMRL